MDALPILPVISSRDEAGRFFDDAFIHRASDWSGVNTEVRAVLDSSAERFRRDTRLRESFWHHHDLLFRRPEDPEYVRLIDDAEKDLGDTSNMLQALLFLSAVPLVSEMHRGLGISEKVTRDTLSDLMIQFHQYKAARGRWGMRNLAWLYNHLRGRLFQVGRLQFIAGIFRGKLTAYRHRPTGGLAALAHDGIRFRRDGQMDGTSGVWDEQAWTSSFRESPDGITGNPIHANGKASPQKVRLPTPEWHRVLDATTPVLGVHIPGGSPMTFDACGQSLKESLDFFTRIFPGKKFEGFECVSWFLDNQLREILSPESNLVRFQKEFHLYPAAEASDQQTFQRVFGGVPADLAKAPAETSLQRALLAHLRAGKHFHHGGAFLLVDDMAWGQQPYVRASAL